MIQFVLHRPRNPKNIGAAARGMANFGFKKLAVVEPYSQAWKEVRSAVHAADVVHKAKKYKTLKSAVLRSHLVVGTSAGSRRKQDAKWIFLDDLPALVEKNIRQKKNVSIVFGSEKTGLSKEDLNFCHVIVKIPTVEECPSMNLSQAVAVVAFALRGGVKRIPSSVEAPSTVPVENIERLIAHALSAYWSAGLLKRWTKEGTEQRIRKAFNRWNLSSVDIAMLHGLFRWVLQQNKST